MGISLSNLDAQEIFFRVHGLCAKELFKASFYLKVDVSRIKLETSLFSRYEVLINLSSDTRVYLSDLIKLSNQFGVTGVTVYSPLVYFNSVSKNMCIYYLVDVRNERK